MSNVAWCSFIFFVLIHVLEFQLPEFPDNMSSGYIFGTCSPNTRTVDKVPLAKTAVCWWGIFAGVGGTTVVFSPWTFFHITQSTPTYWLTLFEIKTGYNNWFASWFNKKKIHWFALHIVRYYSTTCQSNIWLLLFLACSALVFLMDSAESYYNHYKFHQAILKSACWIWLTKAE